MLSCSLKRELEMKLTENRVDTLIDTLNDLICDEQSITREQRENLIKTVATLGGLKGATTTHFCGERSQTDR